MNTIVKKSIPIILVIIAILGLILSTDNQVDIPKETGIIETKKINFDTPQFTKDDLKEQLKKHNIHHIDIVYAQAKLETGNFKSKLFIKNNNLFGFRGKNDYVKYNHWTESVKAYSNFQKEYYRSGDYYIFLNKVGYAEDTNYIKKVKQCVE